jgi:ArsR family transcriptional regulator
LVKSNLPHGSLLTSLYRTIDDLPLSPEVQGRIQVVYEARAYASRIYFERHVEQFSKNQGLLCDLGHYLPNLSEVLDVMKLPRPSHVMEVGPGQGELLRELLRRYDHLVALDISQEMLNFTRLSMALQNKIKFIKCALEDYQLEGTPFDALVLNMVLHHLPSPIHAFQKSRQILKQGGYLVIADLGLHNQEWTRTSCGDVWLGFDPQDLDDWANRAGFREEESLYLGLKNGFQIQIKLFQLAESHH